MIAWAIQEIGAVCPAEPVGGGHRAMDDAMAAAATRVFGAAVEQQLENQPVARNQRSSRVVPACLLRQRRPPYRLSTSATNAKTSLVTGSFGAPRLSLTCACVVSRPVTTLAGIPAA